MLFIQPSSNSDSIISSPELTPPYRMGTVRPVGANAEITQNPAMSVVRGHLELGVTKQRRKR